MGTWTKTIVGTGTTAEETADAGFYARSPADVTARSNATDSIRRSVGFVATSAPMHPKAQITSATLRVNVISTAQDDPNLFIRCENRATNPPVFPATAGTDDVNNRTKTGANTSWIVDGIGTGQVTSPSFASAVAEAISQVGWTTNWNLVVFFAANTDTNKRLNVSAEGSGNEALLTVVFTDIIEGDASLSLTAAGDLSLISAGPTILDLGTALASLSLTGGGGLRQLTSIASASTLSLTASATLTGQWALSGGMDLSLTAAATLTGQWAIAGDASLSLTSAATLTGLWSLAGDAPLSLTAVGSLDIPAAPPTILDLGTAPATLSLTGGGELGGIWPLASDATLSLTAAGSLRAATSMAGDAPLSLTASATLTALTALTPSVIRLSLVSSGTLGVLGVLPITGPATLSLTLTGDMTAEQTTIPARKKRKGLITEKFFIYSEP